jgi:predicted GNAT family acetyltransferase
LSLYAAYIKERLGKSVYGTKDGFVIYWFLDHPRHGKCVYIEDIYVAPEVRKHGVAANMADQVCEFGRSEYDATTLLGSVSPDARGATASLQVLLSYGMTLDGIDNGLIFFFKALGD